MAPLLMPQLFDDRNIEPLAKIAEAVHAAGCKLAIQLWHSGVRGFPVFKQESHVRPRRDLVHAVAEPGAARRVPGRLDAEGDVGGRRSRRSSTRTRRPRRGRSPPAVDGVEFHLSHGYLPWQFLSPLYNKRTDQWGGSYENRLRFPLEALARMRQAIGDEPFLGYRINSTSFWPGDLEIDDIKTDRPGHRGGGRHRLRQRLCRRPPRVHPHADGVRARLGDGLRARDPGGLVEAGAARRPDHDAGRRRDAARGRRRRCDLPRAPAVHRSRVGDEGAGGPRRRTSGAASRRTIAGRASAAAGASSASTTPSSAASASGARGR